MQSDYFLRRTNRAGKPLVTSDSSWLLTAKESLTGRGSSVAVMREANKQINRKKKLFHLSPLICQKHVRVEKQKACPHGYKQSYLHNKIKWSSIEVTQIIELIQAWLN